MKREVLMQGREELKKVVIQLKIAEINRMNTENQYIFHEVVSVMIALNLSELLS